MTKLWVFFPLILFIIQVSYNKHACHSSEEILKIEEQAIIVQKYIRVLKGKNCGLERILPLVMSQMVQRVQIISQILLVDAYNTCRQQSH